METRIRATSIYANTRGPARCRSCDARVEWAQLVATNKVMPFNVPLVAIRAYQDSNGRIIEVVDLATSHFATCPDANRWRRRRT